MKACYSACCCFLLLAATSLTSQAQPLWLVGTNDGGWTTLASNLDGGGVNASSVQENGTINPLPGRPDNPEVDVQSDNDYYFAGIFTTVIDSVTAVYGPYEPIGVVAANEESLERAFGGADNDMRFHFNLPEGLQPDSLLSVTFDVINLEGAGGAVTDSRYGVEVYFNGVLVQEQIVFRPAQFNVAYTTPQFTVADVNAGVGPGYDNIVSLKGISYSADGGGRWMGFDYVQLNNPTERIPPAVFPWAVGKDDNLTPVGDGGGENTTFVQESGGVNPLPGSPTSPETDRLADNDYYFAGNYTTVIAGNGAYQPVGLVPVNEEAAERALTSGDTELRYHFNLPNTFQPGDPVAISFDALSLDTTSCCGNPVPSDPRFGVEVYFNGVKVQTETLIRPAQLNKTFTTAGFSLGNVNARFGSGYDNIVTLKGISYSGSGGGEWLGIDYIQLNPAETVIPPPVLPWSVGIDDDLHPLGDGGGPNASFVAENGSVNALPGSPTSPEIDRQADNDYYLAGSYTTVIAGNGVYTPVGPVPFNEEAAERAFAAADTELRYHFNLPSRLSPSDSLSVSFDALSLDTSGSDPRWGVEVYVNGVLVMPQTLIRPAQLGEDFVTPRFTLGSVNAGIGPGFDNIITLKGISFNGSGGGNWMGIDYVQLTPHPTSAFPWSVGREDNAHPAGNGGGPNASFMQETGAINPLPGNPDNVELDTQSDNDYYFAGIYTTALDGVTSVYGPYDPVGIVLANEESAERAFAAADNDLRYHFNLPTTLGPDDLLSVTFDAVSLDGVTEVNTDPRYGIEVWINGVMVQEQIVIRPAELGKDYSTAPVTLASVGAQVGVGFDNIVSLKGISYNTDGGGNWMGIDYVMLNKVNPGGEFPWAVGRDDNGTPVGNGGGPNTSFVQEAGGITPLPGSYANPEVDLLADNDYYFAGTYETAIFGAYTPVGLVPANEEAAERAFAGTDTEQRYHFNLPSSLKPEDLVQVTFDAYSLDTSGANPRWGTEVYFNGVLVQPEILIGPGQLDVDFTTPPFTLASVNAQVGPGFDNVVTLKGISYNADGGGNWMGIDYVQLSLVPLKFLPPVVNNGTLTLNWTLTGQLEWAPTILGPWTPVTPAPAAPPYSEAVVPGQNRFFRLKK